MTSESSERAEIRTVLVDDHEMVRQALAQILAESESIRVVGQAGDGRQAIEIADRLRPDVMVLDYTMPDFDGPSAVETLHQRYPDIKLLVLTVHESIHYAVRVLEAGAHGYVIKSSAVQELVEAIRAVNAGDIYISPKVSQRVIQHLRRPKRDRIGVQALSPREFDLLRVLGAGMGLAEAAAYLKISPSTASTYRSRLMEKLNLQSTAEIIRFALENDIVG